MALGKNILDLLCLDKDGKTLFEKNDLVKNKNIEEFTTFYFGFSKNNKILYFCTGEKYLKQTNTFYNLRSFDENFNLLAKLKLDKKPIFYGVNGEIFFLLNKNELCSTISMYNSNLEVTRKFGQENPLLPFFCSLKICRLLVSNQYFIINELINEGDSDHKSVSIINRSNGLVESSFVIDEKFSQIKLYLDKFLITFDNKTCFLKCYNFKGDLLHKTFLDKKLEGGFINVINKELCFELDNDKFFFFLILKKFCSKMFEITYGQMFNSLKIFWFSQNTLITVKYRARYRYRPLTIPFPARQ
jgi:hypothetical protein